VRLFRICPCLLKTLVSKPASMDPSIENQQNGQEIAPLELDPSNARAETGSREKRAEQNEPATASAVIVEEAPSRSSFRTSSVMLALFVSSISLEISLSSPCCQEC
jgi:hypothetical protein